MKTLKTCLFLALVIGAVSLVQAQQTGVRPTGSGGVLSYEQAAYDVSRYDISAEIDPAKKNLKGSTIITARIISPVDWFVLDLDTPFRVTNTTAAIPGKGNLKVENERRERKIWIKLPLTVQPGTEVKITVSYEGSPRVARNPPWVGGFMWEKTPGGKDWVVNACQNDGADCWFPVKDHPSDKADEVAVNVTVPGDLYVASIGKLQEVISNLNGTQTYRWLMSSPISNYNIVINIAPYQLIEREYTSVTGEQFPIIFYAIPESIDKAPKIIDQTVKFLDFFERHLGPYPFRDEKLGIAETPHLGMEHSTIIAYGNKFQDNQFGFDWLMLHELGHEWFANLVTASDWRDMWIHEGFQSFLDSLYIEEVAGREAYMASIRGKMRATNNIQPVAPREPRITYEIYYRPPDYTQSDGDIYGKGAVILHTLRHLIGDDAFFRALRRMSYPTKEMEKMTGGGQVRFATTDDFLFIAEEESGMDLDWFFEVYLRQPELPELIVEQEGSRLSLSWKTPNGLPFPMPIDLIVGGERQRLNMNSGRGELTVRADHSVEIDPEGWILRKELAESER
ncbi:MAG: M1 family peptidase [Acidobacteria bacterium]|nr:MAG: M1 family peptidase [Acidobacteriota bacterium]REK03952.1 MAG: M1 family peptidase [Acidobacteriota bacterium]REK15114.1 MAG: M1 family peptidase [Acidobacteriota bacterium]REK46204.1 MAG: M1 family peptidase [Acidobacteriota bacterium]